MKITAIVLSAFVLIVSACKKNKENQTGLYTEVSPDAGASTINWIENEKVIRHTKGSNDIDTFLVSYPKAGKIRLTYTGHKQKVIFPGFDEYEYNRIDANSFELGNLVERTKITYKK